MKKNRIIKVCGSVIKRESIIPVTKHLLENTCVAEADYPYAGYYSHIPTEARPDSLFLFTRLYYTLEEVLRVAQRTETCLMQKINLGAGTLTFGINQYPVIRVKNFPAFDRLAELQECFIKQGIQFARKVIADKEAIIRINKCFELEEMESGIYLDRVEKDKGYIRVNRLLGQDEFDEMLSYIRNNESCYLFDAVKCGIIVDSKVQELVRIYAEKLEVRQLLQIRDTIQKAVTVAAE